jgi:hypothetical protein
MIIFSRSAMIASALCATTVLAAAQGVPNSTGNPLVLEQPKTAPPAGTIAPASQIVLTPEQKLAIFNAVNSAASKVTAPANTPATVGAQVPPEIQLATLPDNALAAVPEAKGMRYALVQDQVVIVDPTTMRVVDVIKQ